MTEQRYQAIFDWFRARPAALRALGYAQKISVLGVYLVIGHLAGLISFGIPYLVPFIKKEQKGSRGEGILRVPLRKRVLRPLYAREEQKIRLKRKESGS